MEANTNTMAGILRMRLFLQHPPLATVLRILSDDIGIIACSYSDIGLLGFAISASAVP